MWDLPWRWHLYLDVIVLMSWYLPYILVTQKQINANLPIRLLKGFFCSSCNCWPKPFHVRSIMPDRNQHPFLSCTSLYVLRYGWESQKLVIGSPPGVWKFHSKEPQEHTSWSLSATLKYQGKAKHATLLQNGGWQRLEFISIDRQMKSAKGYFVEKAPYSLMSQLSFPISSTTGTQF